MENKIIPTIFALDDETFEKKVKILEFVPEIHLDFMDGEFTLKKSVSISSMKSILNYSDKKFQIHLMAKNPIQYVNQIKFLGIKTVLIQEEVFDLIEDLGNCIHQFKDLGINIFVVLNPDTSFDRVKKYFDILDGIMVMSVVPGAEGQAFIESTYDKVCELRSMVGEQFVIQIDGGVSINNSKKLKQNGANNLCVGSYISSSDTPVENYQKLIDSIK